MKINVGNKSKLLRSEDSIPSSYNRPKLNFKKMIFQWKILSLILIMIGFALLIFSELGFFYNDDMIRFEGKFSDQSLIKTFKNKLLNAVDASQHLLESGYEKFLKMNNDENHSRKIRSISYNKNPLKKNFNNFNLKNNKGIYKLSTQFKKLDRYLKQLRTKRSIREDADIDPLQNDYIKLKEIYKEKKNIEYELFHLQRDYIRCKKNTFDSVGNCQKIHKEIFKLLNEVQMKLALMSKILESNKKFSNIGSISLSTKEFLLNFRQDNNNNNNNNNGPAGETENDTNFNNTNFPLQNERKIIEGFIEGSDKLTKTADKNVTKIDDENNNQELDSNAKKFEFHDFESESNESHCSPDTTTNLDETTSSTLSEFINTTPLNDPKQLAPMKTDEVYSNVDERLIDFHNTGRIVDERAFIGASGPFLNLCEQIMRGNGFKTIKNNLHSFQNGITNAPTLNQVTNRGGHNFPVTAETSKASAQVVFNPNWNGIPVYPICFFASPANIRFPNQQIWSPQMQFHANNFPGIFNGFNNGEQISTIFQNANSKNLPISFPVDDDVDNVNGIDPRSGDNLNLGFIYVPPNFANIAQTMNVGPFGTSTGSGIGRSAQQFDGLSQTAQPYFCAYSPTSRSNISSENWNIRKHMEINTKNLQKPKKLNFPSETDIIYASYANRMAANFGNVLQSPDCTPGFVQCASANAQCIPADKWCDSEVDCIDASDETACTCKARLSDSRICDGYPDCPLGEDEWGCYGCHQAQFSCYNNLKEFEAARNSSLSMCYSKMEKCDGFKNCLNGKDEEECSMIVKTLGTHQSYSISYTEGYLHRNFKGKWYPVCGNYIEWAKEACKAEQDDLNDDPQITAKPGTMPGPFIAKKSKIEEPILSQSCKRHKFTSDENVVIYVKCPEIKCGRVKKIERKMYSKRSALMLNEKKKVIRFKRNDDRVVGGIQSQPMKWPFIVALYRNGRFHCGGVIYNQQWILTAAHCVLDYHQNYYEIRAGLLRRSSYGPMIQSVVVENIIPHEYYERENMKNDLALLRLKQPLMYNRWVRPICMPDEGRSSIKENWIWGPEEGTVCTAVGWGAVRENGSGSDVLLQVNIPILKTCKRKNDKEAEDVCAGEANGGRDACQGDSGGPLFCRSVSDNEEWYLAGIVSHGEGCARPGEPGVYTRVALYEDWIDAKVNSENLLSTRPISNCPGFTCIWGGMKCIEGTKQCNKIVDCLGGEDEIGCTYDQVLKSRNNDNDFTTSNTPPVTTPINMKDFTHESTTLTINDSTEELNEEKITTESEETTELPNQTHESITLLSTTEMPETTDNTTFELDSTTSQTEDPVSNFEQEKGREKFMCTRIPQNIDKSNRCDRIVDCEDGTDEEKCTCRDFLKGTLSILICDGKIDCNDLTDEQNCGNCTENQFFCSLSQKCIETINVCDGNSDCDFNEDEHDCLALTNGEVIKFDVNNHPKFETKGILTENKNGIWKIVCARKIDYDEKSEQIAEEFCSLLGFHGVQSHNKTSLLIKTIIPPITEELINPRRYSSITKNLMNDFEVFDKESVKNHDDIPIRLMKLSTNLQTPNDELITTANVIKETRTIEIDNDECEGIYLECNPRSNADEPIKINHKKGKIIKLPELKPIFDLNKKPNIFVHPPPPSQQTLDIVHNKTKEQLNETFTSNITDVKEKLSEKHEIFQNIHWPWSVQVFVDGSFKCIGVLLDKYWIAVENECLKDVTLKYNYVAVLLGGNFTKYSKNRSYEQIRHVDCVKHVYESNVLLLHLEKHVHYTRYVLPTFIPQSFNYTNPSYNESKCLIVHYDFNKGIQISPFNTTLEENLCKNDVSSHLKLIASEINDENDSRQRHAVIICKDTDISGWYPQSFFSYNCGVSSFCDININKPDSNSNNNNDNNSTSKSSNSRTNNNSSSNSSSYCNNSTTNSDLKKSFTVQTPLEKSFTQIQEIIDRNECEHTENFYPGIMVNCQTFRCPLGNCLLNESICDGIEDCHDGSDEKFCHVHEEKECERHQFKCNNGKCVHKSQFCNHHNDCGDFSDEPLICSCFTYLQATDSSKICDGIRNCWDKSDEDYSICECTPDKFRCGHTNYCVPKDFVCDKFPDCPAGEDENFCYGIEYPSTKTDLSDGYGQVIEQSYGIWHTKCFPQDTEHEFNETIIGDICNKLGYDDNLKPKYRLIEDTENRSSNNTEYMESKYQKSTKAIIVNKFSPLRLNTDFILFMKPSRPIAKLIEWDETDYLKCNRLEIKCD